jgi:serine/threonine protein kinase
MELQSSVFSDLTSLISSSVLTSHSHHQDKSNSQSRSRNNEGLKSTGDQLFQPYEIRRPPYVYTGRKKESVPRDVEHVFIEPSIPSIREMAFCGCHKLKSIVIPSSVVSIEDKAFYGCLSLTSIVIPESVVTIGAYAFHGCTSLSPIAIPSSVISIGRNAFYRCSKLEYLLIPNSVTSIGALAFAECVSLRTLILPSSIKAVPWGSFSSCISLRTVIIPYNVQVIEWGAFAECISLVSVVIPASINYIAESSFEGCTSLVSVTVPELLCDFGDRCFGDCPHLEMGALKVGTDVFSWLRTRFDFMPLHQVCYRSDVTKEKIADCLFNHPNSIRAVDSLGMSPLIILLLNERMELDMVEELLKHNPDLVKLVGPRGMYPLHIACTIPSVPLCVIKLLSNSVNMAGDPILTVKDDSGYLPCALAIRSFQIDEVILHLYERFPIKASSLGSKQAIVTLDRVRDQYVKKLTVLPEYSVRTFDSLQRHGWVQFSASVVYESSISSQCIHLIMEQQLGVVKFLANCKDLQGRSAMEISSFGIRNALERRLLLFGRYEMKKETPIHKGVESLIIKVFDRKPEVLLRNAFQEALTSLEDRTIGKKEFSMVIIQLFSENDIVKNDLLARLNSLSINRISEEMFIELCVEALNHEEPIELAVKFMTNAEKFRREVSLREKYNLDISYVMQINSSFTSDTHTEAFLEAVALVKAETNLKYLNEFKHAILMPLAETSFEFIYRDERPQGGEIRVLMKELANAIHHLHQKGLIHGNITLQNVVRIHNQLRLNDLGSAAVLGAPFHIDRISGALPPELITRLDDSGLISFNKHFNEFRRYNPSGWTKIKPRRYSPGSFFTVKTCLPGDSIIDKSLSQTPEVTLPYVPLRSEVSIDLWSFGIILFTLHTGTSLFDVNRDNEIISSKSLRELHEWNDPMLFRRTKCVQDPFALRLLRKLLSRNPSERYQSIDEILQDEYFSSIWQERNVDERDSENLIWQEKKIEGGDDHLVLNSSLILSPGIENDNEDSIKCQKDKVAMVEPEEREICSPIYLILLPYKESPNHENKIIQDCFGRDGKAYIFIEKVLEQIMNFGDRPHVFCEEFIKSNTHNPKMYLYFIEDCAGQAITRNSEASMEVDLLSENMKMLLPLMAMSMIVLASTHKSVGIMKMFLSEENHEHIPLDLWTKVESFVSKSMFESNNFQSLLSLMNSSHELLEISLPIISRNIGDNDTELEKIESSLQPISDLGMHSCNEVSLSSGDNSSHINMEALDHSADSRSLQLRLEELENTNDALKSSNFQISMANKLLQVSNSSLLSIKSSLENSNSSLRLENENLQAKNSAMKAKLQERKRFSLLNLSHLKLMKQLIFNRGSNQASSCIGT